MTTFNITSIYIRPIGLDTILAIMSVSTLKAADILYIIANVWVEDVIQIKVILYCKVVSFSIITDK